MSKDYIPARGDIMWLHFDPQAGKELSGHHMALVVSHKILNQTTGQAIVCPITSKIKGRPLDVVLSEEITGRECAIIPDQIKAINYIQRDSEFVTACPTEHLEKVIKIIFACIGGK